MVSKFDCLSLIIINNSKNTHKTIKEIKGYDKYFITDDGKIFSDKYNTRRQLKPRINKKGYYYVNLCKNGKYKSVEIHRLVAKHFLPNFDESLQVNHIDGCKTNDNVSNLEMVTQSENLQHAYKNGLLKIKIGEDHWCAKLTEEQIKEIKQKYIPKVYTQQMLADEYNVSRSAIRFILKGKTWKHIAG